MTAEFDLHLRLYDMLMASQYWTAERMLAHQQNQLAQLLRHARDKAPFYTHRLDAALHPNGDVDWERWHEIPILTRHDLQTHFASMQASEVAAGHGSTQLAESSGSTGRPIATRQTSLTAMAASTANARSYGWHDIDVTRTHVAIYGDDLGKGAYPDGTLQTPWGPPVLRNPDRPGTQYDLNVAVPPEQALEFIQRHRPAYVSGFNIRLAIFAHEAMRLGHTIALDAVLPRGEAVTPMHRQLYRDAFGARAVPIYSSQETYAIAHPCPVHDHYHIDAELVLVEVLDEAGRPVSVGVPGRVVVTPFYNTAQPLIRYQIGDMATLGRACSCRRTLPVLSAIVGRIAHMFRLPGGRRILPNIADADVLELGAQIWQLAQVAPERLEFRYVPGPHQGDEALFADRVRAQLHPDFAISFRRLGADHFEKRRKYIPYVCELPGDA